MAKLEETKCACYQSLLHLQLSKPVCTLPSAAQPARRATIKSVHAASSLQGRAGYTDEREPADQELVPPAQEVRAATAAAPCEVCAHSA